MSKPGRSAKWIIRGLNLQRATLRAANEDASEDLRVLAQKVLLYIMLCRNISRKDYVHVIFFIAFEIGVITELLCAA